MQIFAKMLAKSLALVLALAMGLGMGMAQVVRAQPTDPAAVVDAYIAATGNPEAQLSLVTDDITLRIEPPPPGTTGIWSGKAEAQGFFRFAKSQNDRVERVGSWQVSGNNVTGTIMVLVNDFRQWGVGPVEHTLVTVVEGGKIKSVTYIMAPSERARVGAAAQAYMAAHSGQPPAGMPRTGSELASILAGLLAAALFCVGAGTFARRARP